MIDELPTAAVWLFRSITMSPAGIVEKVMLCTLLEYVWLLAELLNVLSIRISGGASPRTVNAVPQATLFSPLLVQYGLSYAVNTNRSLLSHHCRVDGSGLDVHTH